MKIDNTKKEKYLKQFLSEKTSAIKARQTRINNWLQNEQLYNGVTTPTLLTRSNLHVPKVFEAVQTMSSRLGQMPQIDFESMPEGDDNATELMKALWEDDINKSDGDSIAQNSKIEAGLYGRAVYKLVPSNKGCKVELIDTMSFLINPTATSTKLGLLYCGQQFIYKTLEQIQKDAKKFDYDAEEVKKLEDFKEPSETSASYSQEKSLKDLRLTYLGYANTSQLGAKMIELNEWYTIIDEEWHVMTVANDRFLLRCIPLTEVGLKKPPYVSWGVYPRGVVFWIPGVADVSRDPNLAMDTSINQMIDNNTYRNFGMIFVSSSSGLKQSSITPRPLGVTPVNVAPDKGIKDAIFPHVPPEIRDAITTMQVISQVADNAIGTSAQPIGHKGKMSVTQQAQQAGVTESKNNLVRQNYIKAWEELGQMYADVICNFMTEPRDIKVSGQKPITIQHVTKKNFKDVTLRAKASSSEVSEENRAIKQKAMMGLYELFKDDPKIPGQLYLREIVAKEFKLDPTQIDKLFSPEEPQQPPQPGMPAGMQTGMQTGQPPQQPAQPNTPPANPNNPLLGQTGANAQAQVPPTIR